MKQKNYQNYTWIHLCSLVPIQTVLKSNLNSIIILTLNFTESFSTLWFFFRGTLVCKPCTWHYAKPSQFFTTTSTYDIMRSWQISWFSDFVCFFQNLKIIRPHVRGRVSWTRYSKFLFISWLRPHTGLNNINIIFLLILFYYLNHLRFKFDLIQKIGWNAIN